MNFFIKNNYKINIKDKARQDDFTEKTVEYEQPDVYKFVKHLAEKCNLKYIIDVGCVYHYQTSELNPEFEIIGIGHGKNLEYCKEHYKFAKWFNVDFTKEISLPISEEILKESIVVCTNIIEHLESPIHLINLLKKFLDYCPYAILTAINRDYKNLKDDGPPLNPQHVREWNISEFKEFISENFNLSNIGLSINNYKDKEKSIILTLLENNNNEKIHEKIEHPKDFSVTAIIHCFNEEDIIISSITNLLAQGIKVYVMDNWSTDNTFELLSDVKHEGFLGVERFPKDKAPEYYDLKEILKRKEKISQECIVRFFDERFPKKYFGIIRLGTVLAEDMRNEIAANLFINQALDGKEITPFKHSMHRPMLFITVDDVCKAFRSFIEVISTKEKTQTNSIEHIINLAHSNPISILDLAKIIKKSIEKYSNGKILPTISIIDKNLPQFFDSEDKNKMKFDTTKIEEFLKIDKLIDPKIFIEDLVKKRMSI